MASPSRSEGTAPMVPLRLTDAQLDPSSWVTATSRVSELRYSAGSGRRRILRPAGRLTSGSTDAERGLRRTSFAAASGCRAIAIYEYTSYQPDPGIRRSAD